MTVPRIVGLVALIASVTACGSGTLILWNPKTGECDAVPKAAAYALGGVLFATTQDVDIEMCVSNRHLMPRAILSGHATTGKPRGAGATATARD